VKEFAFVKPFCELKRKISVKSLNWKNICKTSKWNMKICWFTKESTLNCPETKLFNIWNNTIFLWMKKMLSKNIDEITKTNYVPKIIGMDLKRKLICSKKKSHNFIHKWTFAWKKILFWKVKVKIISIGKKECWKTVNKTVRRGLGAHSFHYYFSSCERK